MNSSFFLGTVAVAIGFFTLFKKFRFHQDDKESDSSSSPPSSVPPSSVPPSFSSHSLTHQVFPSFRGEDVRRDFLSHIQREFQRKGIIPFVDNEIRRGESIGLELIRAIRASKISIVLLSRNYASSKWCLEELVEIMRCREESGQIVMPIFYKVDPSDVKKLTGDFGSVFRSTCAGKTNEVIGKWRQALSKVATITGYDSRHWYNEAAMIEEIVIDILNKLNNSTRSCDFDGLVGIEAHMEKMKALLCIDSDEVRMIGIWGLPGIGKTTIARVLFNQVSSNFELSVFMENIKEFMCTIPLCSDDYSTKLQLQKQFLSQIINHKGIEIPHLGVAKSMFHDKKILVVLDNVDKSIQLDAIAKETRWFGHGSRIIITTQDQKILKAHDDVNHIYKMGLPSTDEARQILCMYAFGQNLPKDGFEKLVRDVTYLSGNLPLGLRVMGSFFRGMSKQEWKNVLPRLSTRLDASIESILKFSYDALCDEDKDLFLHITCIFDHVDIDHVEENLADTFLDVRQGLHVLSEKSLISMEDGWVTMHPLLQRLGREIVCHKPRKKSIHDPGLRQFLVDSRDIREVLADNTGSRSVIGIQLYLLDSVGGFNISERAFERMSNLKFLRINYYPYWDEGDNKVYLPQGLIYLSQKLRLLEWDRYPLTCLPSNFHTEYLVELKMRQSKLQKLWKGNLPLGNLKWMNLSYSKNLKELPDLSTATNLQVLFLEGCSSLVKVPFSIGNATKLQSLVLSGCSSLVEVPFSIGNVINLRNLDLFGCSSIVELPSSIGNLHKLEKLRLSECSKLEVLPININLQSLNELDLTNCLMLKSFPEISTNIQYLQLQGTAIREVPLSIKSWSRFEVFGIPYFEKLEEFPHSHGFIKALYLNDRDIQEIPPWVKRISDLRLLVLSRCKNLVSVSLLSNSLLQLDAENCESLERLDCCFHDPDIDLNFANCFKLNKEAREFIIKTSTHRAVLPGKEVPAHFTYRTPTGSSMTVNCVQGPLSTNSRFKACILLVNKDVQEGGYGDKVKVNYSFNYKPNDLTDPNLLEYDDLPVLLTEHLYMIEVEIKEAFTEIIFKFSVLSDKWVIGEGGVLQLF